MRRTRTNLPMTTPTTRWLAKAYFGLVWLALAGLWIQAALHFPGKGP